MAAKLIIECFKEKADSAVLERHFPTVGCYRDTGLARGFLAGAIQDAAFGEFRRQLAYKCQWYGRTLICIDRTSQAARLARVVARLRLG